MMLAALTSNVVAAENESLPADELTLRAAHIGTDGPSLLQFFRKLMPRDERFERIPPHEHCHRITLAELLTR